MATTISISADETEEKTDKLRLIDDDQVSDGNYEDQSECSDDDARESVSLDEEGSDVSSSPSDITYTT